MEKKIYIDINDKDEAINEKIGMFCSVLMKMPYFSVWAMVDEETNSKLVEPEIIKGLFSDLEKKNKLVDDDGYVSEKFSLYAIALCAHAKGEQQEFFEKYSISVNCVISKPPIVSAENISFKEMTNREFLKKFIKEMIDLNKQFRAMPKWERISSIFLAFVATMSGIRFLINCILSGSKLMCFLGILIMLGQV